ncbi:MAG: ParA family protein [Treponematales bacterium]
MILTITSWKGGTGKTTLSTAAALIAAARGYRVLVIDMDANCTASGVFDAVFKPKTVMDFLQGGEPPVCETKIAGVNVIPACLNLVQINNLIDFQLRSSIRRSGLEGKFDLIIIDPPGYWGSHTRNAVFAADTIVVPGCCSRLDFCATETYLQTLEQCALDADLFVAVNAFDKRRSDMGALEDYRREFARYLAPEPVPASLTLKRVTADPARPMHPVTRKRLERFVSHITGGKFDEIRPRD